MCCKFIIGPILFLLLIIVVFFATFEGRYQFYKLSSLTSAEMAALPPEERSPFVQSLLEKSIKVTFITTILACKGDYGVCGRAEFGRMWTRMYGDSDYGGGIGQYKFAVKSHKQYVAEIYNPAMQRHKDIFVGANLTKIAPGIVPSNTMLQLNTDDPERVQRRKLMAEALTALKRHPTRPTLLVPDWIKPNGTDFASLTGVNIFNWMFDIKLDDKHVRMLAEYNQITGPIALGLGTGHGSEDRVVEIYDEMKSVIRGSKIGKNFMTMAEERGMDKEARLHELCAVLLFAGYGGTSQYVTATMDRIRSDPALYVPLYLKNKVAFLKESARIAPPVGGMVFVMEREATAKFYGERTGETMHLEPGDLGVMWLPNANKDRNVFGGPERSEDYANKFDPTRDNLDKLLTWNGLLDDIERGFTTDLSAKGHAPRPCPGAIFALQMCEKVVDYFIAPHVDSSTGGGEL